MKALTIKQPWAHAIVFGTKRIENRTWAPSLAIGERFAIHAGARFDADISNFRGYPDLDLPGGITLSAIVGVATFRRVIHGPSPSQERWWSGPLAWELDDVRAITPVYCSGARKLWHVPGMIQKLIDEQLA